MQITFATNAVSGFSLSEGGNESPSGLKVNGKQLTQVAEYLRGPQVSAFGRQNFQTAISFRITRKHTTISDSEEFVLTYASSFPLGQGIFTFVTESSASAASTVTTYMVGVINDINLVEQIGVTTIHEYSLTGGLIVSTAPTLPSS